jgi:RimJ/RimL family protein N-acetyltransferase
MRCTQPPSDKAATAAARYRAALPVLETQRLVLRAAAMDDFQAWTKILAEAFDDTPEQAWDEFTNYTAGWVLHGHGLFVACRKSDNAATGFVMLGLEWGDEEPELGYMFDAEFHGQGYATEACMAVRDFGFDLLGQGNFVSYISTKNDRSSAMAARLGAIKDGAFDAKTNIWRHGERA